MENLIRILCLIFLITGSAVIAAMNDHTFDYDAQKLLDKHVEKYKNIEYFSGAALAVYIPGQNIHNFYNGTVSLDPKSTKVSDKTLFQIGSITKSFTAAIALQLENEGKLNIDKSISYYLPHYKKWSEATIKTALNMSSNLPNYSDTPLWNATEFKNPEMVWSNQDLLSFVYPKEGLNPPLKSGYMYSNTGYILTDLIIESVTKNNFKNELNKRTIHRANLLSTFYPIPKMTNKIRNRMAHGYNYNQYANPELVGKDISNVNLSWAVAAGGIVSTPEDVVKWVRALFTENKILNDAEKIKMMNLVSTQTGEPIKTTSADDPKGFGLGVVQAYSSDDSVGRFWYYEGETLGFRALYMYTPCNHVIISSVFNSATNSENDHASELMMNVYKSVLDANPELRCKS